MRHLVKPVTWAFLFGMTTGGLMAISIKYPVTEKTIGEAAGMCQPNFGLEKLDVGLSGKVYYVRCKNGKEFDLK